MALAASAMSPSHGDIRERLVRLGHGHVLRSWEALDEVGRRRLASQLERVDLDALAAAAGPARQAPSPAAPARPRGGFTPPDVERHPAHGGDRAAFDRAREAGEAWLAEGRVAALVVAGGQGTRLGWEGPKGAFPIGPVTGRSLFALQAQRLRRLARRLGRPVPWLVMTSEDTDAATRALFARERGFGLDPAQIHFFRQASLPVLDRRGRLLLAAPDRLAEAPDGHGGAIPALVRSGLLDALEARGVEAIFHYQVDNPLLPVCDPVLLGFHHLRGAEATSKVIRRRAPDERVGTAVRDGDRVRILEYSEIGEPEGSGRDAAGALRFDAGSIGVHVFTTGLVRRVAADADVALPLHAAPKPVRALDPDATHPFGALPRSVPALKLERFVFDALPCARRVVLVEALREQEYAPVKNAHGGESPATARRALDALYRRWLAAAGVDAPPPGTTLEIDHARIEGPEDLRARRLRAWHEAGDAVIVGDGARE